MSPLLELEQECAAGHVLELAGGVAPVPRLAQRFGELPPAPVGVLADELTDKPQILGTQLAALKGEGHGR